MRLLLASALIVASTLYARAADTPARPDCHTIRSYVASIGESLAIAVARARGYTHQDIQRIRVACNMPEKK